MLASAAVNLYVCMLVVVVVHVIVVLLPLPIMLVGSAWKPIVTPCVVSGCAGVRGLSILLLTLLLLVYGTESAYRKVCCMVESRIDYHLISTWLSVTTQRARSRRRRNRREALQLRWKKREREKEIGE